MVWPQPLRRVTEMMPIEWDFARCQTQEVVDGLACGWKTVIEPITSEAICGVIETTSEAACGVVEVTSEALCGTIEVIDAALCGVETFFAAPWDVLTGMDCSCSGWSCECTAPIECEVANTCEIAADCEVPDTCIIERECNPAIESCDPAECEVELCGF